jgi:membrane-bound lytic murein transglycosylase D
MKKRFFILLMSYLLLTRAEAQKNASSVKLADHPTSDSVGVSSSDKSTKKPDYEGFKDLFINDASVGGIIAPKLNPRAVSFVEDYIEKHSKDLADLKQWALPFFNMMDGVFVQNGLPTQLKYLAVIESKLRPMAVSWAGAVGPWQFMPGTAIRMGLKVTRNVDERIDYIKSTQAAAKYLKELYDQFGDWLLVIAAYNGGAGNVNSAIRRSKSHNFWDLQYYLPTESRNHVKKFIGTHYILEGQGGMTTLTKAEVNAHYGQNGLNAMNRELSQEEIAAAKTQVISGKYYSVAIARNLAMDMEEFNRYNPGFDKAMASARNSYELKLTEDKMEQFNANRYQILNESIQRLLTNASVMKEVKALQEKNVSPKKRVKH